jgi:hypothetical protein
VPAAAATTATCESLAWKTGSAKRLPLFDLKFVIVFTVGDPGTSDLRRQPLPHNQASL